MTQNGAHRTRRPSKADALERNAGAGTLPSAPCVGKLEDAGLRRCLLRWYQRHRRSLPWRATRDPFAIWVSEVMLQQTRVETVLRYYPRFLRRFPTIASLARARQSSVLAHWSGLGYYGRARSLHAAARLVVERHGGRLPRDPHRLRALPGIGRYTAGAIASIAFGARAAVVDGNVARVLARLSELPGPLRSPEFERRAWQLAERLVPRKAPGDWNQALMELGATVCTATAPRCASCPVRRFCAAARTGTIDRHPEAGDRPDSRAVRRACVVVERGDRVLLAREDDRPLLRGLWRFPGVEVGGRQSAARVARAVLRRLGVGGASLRAGGTIRHTIMDQRIETLVFRASITHDVESAPSGARWFRWGQFPRLPLSAVELRVARELAPASPWIRAG
jgi:A/G-specific adenine glycosylase